MYINYVNHLTKSKQEMQRLKQEFPKYVKPDDQFVLRVERLLKHIDLILNACTNSWLNFNNIASR